MKADSQLILDKYISLPEKLQEEVADFIDFLMFKQQRQEKSHQEGIPGRKEGNKRRKKKSNFGSARGLIVIKSDFDQPIEDFKEYM
jgi:hypothetical protein